MTQGKPNGKHPYRRLSAQTVKAIKRPGLHSDGEGLYLKVDVSGAKRWIQRIVIQGRRRDIGLGSARLVNLLDARERALENRKIARAGDDPLAARDRVRQIPTFGDAARTVHELARPHWRNEKHGLQWLTTLETYAFPALGRRSVDKISSGDILSCLSPIWNSKPETARRVKQRIGKVMSWAVVAGFRSDDPTAAVAAALPKHDSSTVQHMKALPYTDVASAIGQVKASGAAITTKLAFEFLVLTATRSGETLRAEWSEIDFATRTWIIPASKMKAKRPHRVPLSTDAIALLEVAKGIKRATSDLIFPGLKKGKPLSDMTLSKLMKELNIPAVPHGFRSSFRDWCGEQSNYPHQVVEFALAHVIPNKAEAAYARSDLLEKRRPMMEEWSTYLRITQ